MVIGSFTTPPAPGNAYTIIQAGTVAGNFSSLSLPAGITGSLSYTSTTCVLTLSSVEGSSILRMATLTPRMDSAAGSLLLYPNPATTTVTVRYPAAGVGASIRILANTGQVMGAVAVPAGSVRTQLDVGLLAKGLYWIDYYDGIRHRTLGLIRE
jgi:hypothetical protein